MHRFFVPPELLRVADASTTITLPEKVAHQVRTVLHLVPGEQLILLDNSGYEFLCSVVSSDPQRGHGNPSAVRKDLPSNRASVTVEVQQRRAGLPESTIQITLCQGLHKSARFEWILEKGTELGVASFVPMLCHRSMSGLQEAGPAKVQRWQRIIQEAAEQCGRARMPELQPIRPLAQALKDLPPDTLAFIPWEEEHGTSLHTALSAAAASSLPSNSLNVVLFIGPEGGLLAEEIQLARQHGVQPVTLGQRILRAETAALAAVANVMYELER